MHTPAGCPNFHQVLSSLLLFGFLGSPECAYLSNLWYGSRATVVCSTKMNRTKQTKNPTSSWAVFCQTSRATRRAPRSTSREAEAWLEHLARDTSTEPLAPEQRSSATIALSIARASSREPIFGGHPSVFLFFVLLRPISFFGSTKWPRLSCGFPLKPQNNRYELHKTHPCGLGPIKCKCFPLVSFKHNPKGGPSF